MIFISCILAISCKPSKKVQIDGEMKVWHTITLTFNGPETTEYDTINPFTDYRLDIEFTDGSQKINVPGYYAADGDAAHAAFSFDCARLAAPERAGDRTVRGMGGGGFRADPVGGGEGLAGNPVLRDQRLGNGPDCRKRPGAW